MKNGAYDYIVKCQGYLKTLPHSVETTNEKHDLLGKLRASEDKYKRLAENANDLIFTTDKFGNFTLLTSRVNSLLGYSPEELLGGNFKTLLAGGSGGVAQALLPGELQTESNQLVELDFMTKSGQGKSFELNLSTVTRAGKIAGLEAIGRDITRRKVLERELLQRNKELTTLLSVTSAIAQSLNIEEISSASLLKICEFLGLDCGAIYCLGLNNSPSEVSGSHHLTESLFRSLHESKSWEQILDQLAESGKPIVSRGESSGQDIPAELVQAFGREQVRSFIILPLSFKEKMLGLVVVGSRSQTDFSSQEIEILSSISNQIGGAIANARLFSAIREAKIEWETTFDAMSELISMQNLQGEIVRVNRAMARRLKLELWQIVNRRAEEVFHDAKSPWCNHHRPEIYEANKIVAVEFDDKVLDGTFEIATVPIYDLEGQLFAWLFVGKDITQQRQLQNQFVQIERLNALGEMASGVAHDFNNVLAGILGKTQLMLAALDKGGES